MPVDQKNPIVLVHGIARFDILHEMLKKKLSLPENKFEDRFEYFKGIKTHLEAHGFRTFHTNQDFAGPVALRAEQLKTRIKAIITDEGADRVHLISHSMGALDARHMIVDLGMADSVASLTTVGGPHLGTILADHVLDHGGNLLVETLRQVINLDGFEDLRVTACEQFNSRAENDEARNSVFYQTYASSEELKLVFLPLIPSWLFIQEHEGKNDGLVSFRSQQWKNELIASDGTRKPIVQKEFPFPADHLNEIGWWDPQETVNPILGFATLFKQPATYENKVKGIYLEIAQNLP
ncbi:MAG: triacylglycerol lipase [Blastocatellia bacterium]|jgi:triacylglycerol lipase|nr:triacylglycerol lipase [Blastocatellia bacterium]